jgi:hypothetical protein
VNIDDKKFKAAAQGILMSAALKFGGTKLGKHLGIPDTMLVDWLVGKTLPPLDVLQRAAMLLDPDMAPGTSVAALPKP